ncbi:hypothetical protein EBR57_11160 [bacterium]|nr:hypothetical protein [bacterium]
MASAKSRSKLAREYEPTTPINQKFPKPPRYYMGVLFTEDDRILFNDALFYHLDDENIRIVNRDPKRPFDGECPELEGVNYDAMKDDGEEIEIVGIQYAIGIVTDDDKYVYRLFNHKCDEPAILYVDENDGSLCLEAKMELDSSKEVMGVESPYPVTQFIN